MLPTRGTGKTYGPHWHSRCALGDVDNIYHMEPYARRDAAEENEDLGFRGSRFSADHIQEVYPCNLTCSTAPMVNMHLVQTWKD